MIRYWWHVFGAETEEFGGAWAMVTFGESTLDTEEAKALHPESMGTPLAYLGSFDHEPTDDELESLTPEEYREEE